MSGRSQADPKPTQSKASSQTPGVAAKESSHSLPEEVGCRLGCQRQACPAAGPTVVIALAGTQEGDMRLDWAALVA